MERAADVLPESASISYAADSYAAASDADALLILTDWNEFAELDLHRLNQALRYPIIIDGRNLYEPATMLQNGFTYISIGRSVVSPHRDLKAFA